MKITKGFISNSSSSSFYLFWNDKKDLKKLLLDVKINSKHITKDPDDLEIINNRMKGIKKDQILNDDQTSTLKKYIIDIMDEFKNEFIYSINVDDSDNIHQRYGTLYYVIETYDKIKENIKKKEKFSYISEIMVDNGWYLTDVLDYISDRNNSTEYEIYNDDNYSKK